MNEPVKRMLRAACLSLLCFFLFSGMLSGAAAEEEIPWNTAAEAEAARALAEEQARALAQDLAKKNATVDRAEAELEEAEEALAEAEEALETVREAAENAPPAEKNTAEESLRKAEDACRAAEKEVEKWSSRAEKARQEADAIYAQLAEAAMALKTATEASVRMTNAEQVDESRITASFGLGERFNGSFNENLDPMYLRFLMDRDAKVRVSTTEARVSISVLDAGGNTIFTLVPTTGGSGSVCSLAEGEYILMVATMGTEKKVSIAIQEYHSADSPEDDGEDLEEEEWEDETEMVTLVEFD